MSGWTGACCLSEQKGPESHPPNDTTVPIAERRWPATVRDLGCVRLGNPDLDFQNLNPDFPIEREILKRISPREIRPQGGFQLRNPNPNFLDFLFTVRLGNQEKDLQNCLVNSGLLFANYACACKTAVLKNSFSNPFANFPIER